MRSSAITGLSGGCVHYARAEWRIDRTSSTAQLRARPGSRFEGSAPAPHGSLQITFDLIRSAKGRR
jgi:hypothetical protein